MPDSDSAANFIRYQSASGFFIETTREFETIFRPEDNSVIWAQPPQLLSDRYVFSQVEIGHSQPFCISVSADLDPIPSVEFQTLEFPHFVNNLDPNLEILRNLSPEGFLTLDCEATDVAVTQYLDDLTVCYMPSTTVTRQLYSTQRFFEEPIRKVVSHVGTLAGRPYLVSQSQQEAIQLVAREDQFHFEAISLSRNRSETTSSFGDLKVQKVTSRGMSSPWLLVKLSGDSSRASLSVQLQDPFCSLPPDLVQTN